MGSLGSRIWCLKDPTNYTWAWGKVLKLRRIAWDLIDLVVGNGRNVGLWWDKRPLAKVYGSRLIHESGLDLNSKVAAVIVNNEWCWPNACLEAMVEV